MLTAANEIGMEGFWASKHKGVYAETMVMIVVFLCCTQNRDDFISILNARVDIHSTVVTLLGKNRNKQNKI